MRKLLLAGVPLLVLVVVLPLLAVVAFVTVTTTVTVCAPAASGAAGQADGLVPAGGSAMVTSTWRGATVTHPAATAPTAVSASQVSVIGGATVVGLPAAATGPAADLGMSAVQWKRATQIVDVGTSRGIPAQGIVLALGVARQESGFRMYANDGRGGDLAPDQAGVARSLRFPHDAVGSDHGSVNTFQQQYPWWGTLPELMDPLAAAGKFYDALLKVPGWQTLPYTQAAAAVQRPAAAYRGAYADDESPARQIYALLANNSGGLVSGIAGYSTVSADQATCATQIAAANTAGSTTGECPATGSPAEQGLTPDALLVLRCVNATFGPHTYSGVGGRPTNPDSNHPAGRAVDIMIDDWQTQAGIAEGNRIAAWVRDHATDLGVTSVIWRARIWSVAHNDEGWRPYTHPSGATDPTSRHMNHVHVSVAGHAATGLVNDAGLGVGGGGVVVYPVPAQLVGANLDNWGGHGAHWSSWHTGTDFAVPCGTPVLAATGGTIAIDTGQAWAGPHLVKVVTGPDARSRTLATWYAHMRRVLVTPGQRVTAGQQIGEAGDLGNATGCHLHFEVHTHNGTIYGPDNTDPTPWLADHVGQPLTTPVSTVGTAHGGIGGQPAFDGGVVLPVAAMAGLTGRPFRIATFNVLGASHTGANGNQHPGMAPGPARAPGAERTLGRHRVSVAGLQELQLPQFDAIVDATTGTSATGAANPGSVANQGSAGTVGTYGFVVGGTPGRYDTENALIYRLDRWQVLAGHTLPITYFDGHTRYLPVVLLQQRATGAEAWFINAHNPADTPTYGHQAGWRAQALATEAAHVAALRASSGLPVFLTGDLNDRHDPFCSLTTGGLMTTAQPGGTPPTTTPSNRGAACRPPAHPQIDWIFGAGATFDRYTVDRAPLRGISDHPIVIATARWAHGNASLDGVDRVAGPTGTADPDGSEGSANRDESQWEGLSARPLQSDEPGGGAES